MTLIEHMARAIENAEAGYHLKMTKLIDGEATYELRYEGEEEVLEFPSHADGSDYITKRRDRDRATAALKAMREHGPTAEMIAVTLPKTNNPNEQQRELGAAALAILGKYDLRGHMAASELARDFNNMIQAALIERD